jgi:adenosine deaminase
VQTGAVATLESHPLKLYFDLGVRVTINTDNRLITDTSVSKELYLVHRTLGVPFADIKAMIVAGFKSSFQPFHEKQAMLRRVAAELERYDDAGRLRPSASPLTTSDRPRAEGSQRAPAEAE